MSKIENFEMEMKPFHCKRKIWVYLPEGYGADGRVYPVIYMQDGQNLFYKELTLYGDVWHIDTAMERIYRQYGFAAIVVGVENSKDRITEYAPWKSSMKIAGIESMGGRGAEYAQFFAEDLKNEIDRRYNTERGRCGTAVIGSSAGGMISCYIGIRYQEIYGTMGLFSTAVSFNKKAMEESFLFSNMCPQNGNLNRGDWNEMEMACRNWASKYGGVYVVCGPILYKGKHKTIGRNKVVVPEAFFKVVLRTGKDAKAIGFIYKNAEGNRPKGDYVNTVDEVERITGIDFFPSLPDDVEKRVEATADIADW